MDQEIFDDVMNNDKGPLEFAYQEMMRFENSENDFPAEVPDFEINCPSITHDCGRQTLQYLIDKMISLNPDEQPTLKQIKSKLTIIKEFINTQLDIQNINLDNELDKIHQNWIDDKAKKEPKADHEAVGRVLSQRVRPMVSSTFFSSDSSWSFFTTSSISSEFSDTTPLSTSNDETTSEKPSVAN